jgi:TetR/AcrR family transcriptional regulator, transcriptional repressor for nem operon
MPAVAAAFRSIVLKVSKETAAAHRQALLDAATRLFREQGFDQVAIADIAADAGLTHGAFYTHFASKEALCVEAIAVMARGGCEAARQASDFDNYVREYLSPLHVVALGHGCLFAALGGDSARQGAEVRAAFSRAATQVIASYAEVLDGKNAGEPQVRARAIQAIAALVGGIQLARMVANADERDEILTAVREGIAAMRRARTTRTAPRAKRAKSSAREVRSPRRRPRPSP